MSDRWANKHFYTDENEVNGRIAMLNHFVREGLDKGGYYYYMRHYCRDFFGNVCGYCYTIHQRRKSKSK